MYYTSVIFLIVKGNINVNIDIKPIRFEMPDRQVQPIYCEKKNIALDLTLDQASLDGLNFSFGK